MSPKQYKPFWEFVRFYRESEAKRGRHLSIDVAEREASPHWNRMSDHERQIFQQTKEWSFAAASSQQRHSGPKLDSRQKRWRNELRKQRLDYVDSVKDMRTHIFSLACVRAKDNESVPCEITVVRWSLMKGVVSYFHVVCDPQIPRDEYRVLRREVGDTEAIVRIRNTDNSVANREQLRDALQAFCGDSPLLVPGREYWEVRERLQHFDPYGSDFDARFRVLDAEEVFQNLSQRIRHFRLSAEQITEEFHRVMADERHNQLKCDLHQALPQYGCSLKISLSMAYALLRIFARAFGIGQRPVSHFPAAGTRPAGEHWRGNGIDEEDKELDLAW